jgi:hypothetical protein
VKPCRALTGNDAKARIQRHGPEVTLCVVSCYASHTVTTTAHSITHMLQTNTSSIQLSLRSARTHQQANGSMNLSSSYWQRPLCNAICYNSSSQQHDPSTAAAAAGGREARLHHLCVLRGPLQYDSTVAAATQGIMPKCVHVTGTGLPQQQAYRGRVVGIGHQRST